MTIQQLEYILAVDQFRHFARAAEYCRVTQPTLSAMIQKLEEEYGVQISEHWKNYALNVINNFAGEVLAFAMQASSVR